MALDALIGTTNAAAGIGRLVTGTGGGSSAGAAGAAGGADFAGSLKSLLGGVEETAAQANTAVANMVDKTGDVHDAMIALQRSEMALELTVQIRNKFVQAYQDVMRMPI